MKELFKKAHKFSGTWTGTIVIVLTIIFFGVQAFVIPSGSMISTLLIGDMLFVKKFSYGVPIPRIPWLEVPIMPDFNGNGHLIEGDKPQRGDIVVFRYPNDEKIHFVKRCVATGGDIVALQDKHLFLHPKEGNDFVQKNFPKESIVQIENKLWVMDPYEKEHRGIHHDPLVVKDGNAPYQLFDMMPVFVPEGEFFMMGDNRDHSNDSRFWGTVPYKYIVGKPWMVYFSWDEDKNIRWNRVFKTVETLEATITDKDNQHKIEGIH